MDKVKLVAIDEEILNPLRRGSGGVAVFTGAEGGEGNLSEHKAILERAGVTAEKRLLNGATQVPGIHKEKYTAHFSLSTRESLSSDYPNADVKVVNGTGELEKEYRALVANKVRVVRGEDALLKSLGLTQNPGGRKI